jgi:hypothetical protein
MAKNQKQNVDDDADEVSTDNIKEFEGGVLDKGTKINTVVRNLADVIKEKLEQLKDLATMEVLLDVNTRMSYRLKSIKELSSAQHIKVQGHWKTTAPKMHITNLVGKKVNNDERIITFGVFEVDEKGNKKLYEHKTDVELQSGNTVKRTVSAEYRVAYEVKEIIRNGKAIEREVTYLEKPVKGE